MEGGERKLRWGPERRLEFVEFLLYWEGGLNRGDLTERFGVSVPQASSDLATYREMAPTNMEYDSSAKRYVATASFIPRFLKPNPDRYLAQLKAISDGIMELADTWIADTPPNGVLPLPNRRIDSKILRALLGAIRAKCAIHVEYQSMSAEHPAPLWRWITPHAFAFDGLRWHVRLFCHLSNQFLDFVLSRFLAVGETAAAGADAAADWLWQTEFRVVFEPNPDLGESQRAVIAADYGMVENQLVVPVRYALLYYFNKRLRLDAESLDRPFERPVVVANRQDFELALASADARGDASRRSGDERTPPG